MKFFHLPSELIASVIDRCDYLTVINLSETGKQMNKIVKAHQFDKFETNHVDFTIRRDSVMVSSQQWQKFAGTCEFEYSLPHLVDWQERSETVYHKTSQILMSTKSLTALRFEKITIDDKFTQIFGEIRVDWKNVSARFVECNYKINKKDVLSFWKTFKSVEDEDSKFMESKLEIINDEMMMHTLPNITISSYKCIIDDSMERNPGVTDRTLEILAETKPRAFHMSFIVNYTPGGIKNLFTKILSTRDSGIDYFILGVVEINPDERSQLLSYFQTFNTKYSDFECLSDWAGTNNTVKVSYKKDGSASKGCLRIVLLTHSQDENADRQENGEVMDGHQIEDQGYNEQQDRNDDEHVIMQF